jgi:transcriptional regulator with XRE-family HTH domain
MSETGTKARAAGAKVRFNKHALSEFREARSVTKTEMAAALGISLSYYCDLESGHRPGTAALVDLAADFLKVRKLALIENPNLPTSEAAA